MKLSQKFLDLIELTCAPALVGLTEEEIYQTFANKLDPANRRNFQLKSFVGWKSAQLKNLDLQISMQAEDAFSKREPFTIYTFRNLQRLMDAIVWVHFGNTSDMKTIFQPTPVVADLKNHNIDAHIAISAENNKKDDEFWLISDLTSGFKSGDFFWCKAGGGGGFVEAKTGEVNVAIHKLLFEGKREDLLKIVNHKNAESLKKQMYRTLGQVKRSIESQKALKNEPHEDPNYPGFTKSIVVHDRPMRDFGDIVDQMLESFEDGAIKIVEDCLFISVLEAKNEAISPHSRFLAMVEEKMSEPIIGPNCDLAMFLNRTSFTKPMYVQPFSKSSIHDLIGREKSVHLYLSLPRFVNKFRSENIELDLLSGSEMRKIHAKHREYSSKHHEHILRIRDRESMAEGVLSDGLLQKMFSDLFLPSELLNANLIMIRHLFAKST